MSDWPASKARRVLAALGKIGWRVKRQRGSHRLLTRPEWADYEFTFHDKDEIGRDVSKDSEADRIESRRPLTSDATSNGRDALSFRAEPAAERDYAQANF